jgi:hypothetical protein
LGTHSHMDWNELTVWLVCTIKCNHKLIKSQLSDMLNLFKNEIVVLEKVQSTFSKTTIILLPGVWLRGEPRSQTPEINPSFGRL